MTGIWKRLSLPPLLALLVLPWLTGCTGADTTSRFCEPPGSRIAKPVALGPVVHAVSDAPDEKQDGWQVSTLEAEEIDPTPIAKLLTELENGTYSKVDSVLIARNGKLVLEAYFNGFDASIPHDTRSAFKSVTSALTGIAVGQEVIDDIDAPISSYYPDYWPDIPNYRTEKDKITLAHLLTMSPGFNAEENFGIGPFQENDMWTSADWVRFSLHIDMASPPGETFSYNSSSSFLIGEMIARAAGEPLPIFAKAHLFDPLGMTDYCWTETSKGRMVAQGSFFMRPRDMLKFGQLYLDGGVWRGQQIVPEDWIKASTRHLYDARHPRLSWIGESLDGYGYHWWTRKAASGQDPRIAHYFASGNGGQKIYVLPGLQAVVVITGSNYGKSIGHRQPREILNNSILPALK